jgi:hypothetical protein
MSEGYQGIPASDRWGCLAAAIVGIPTFLLLVFVDALGDCTAEADGSTFCQKGFLKMVLLPTIIIMAVVFVGIRTLIRARKSNDR